VLVGLYGELMKTTIGSHGFTSMDDMLTKEQLRERLNLPSTRMVDELVKKRKIPCLKLGHRTVRFSLPKVLAALAKFELKAVGQD
jgi:hypothetical protein